MGPTTSSDDHPAAPALGVDGPIDQLPEIHRRLLELLAKDLAPDVVAEQLGVGVESISPMATVAAAKLARLADTSSPPDDPERP